MGRRHITIETLKKRRASWDREIGTRSEYAEIAPKVVRELDEEIVKLEAELALERLRESAAAADRGEGTSLAGLSRVARRKLLAGKDYGG